MESTAHTTVFPLQDKIRHNSGAGAQPLPKTQITFR